MSDNTNKVIISAEWFDELRRKEKEFDTINGVRSNPESYDAIRKERDELKAKLDCADIDRETYKDRVEAAERCIKEIEVSVKVVRDDYIEEQVVEIIRAYRERKEAK